jgi:hypothetical protein
MANGKQGDHPLTDIVHWKTRRFSEKADALVLEIVNLGGETELERTFNLFKPPPIEEFENTLRSIRDRLYREAKERGWEV